MATARTLRNVNQLISPALEAAVAELDPPVSDGALVALCRRLAATIDEMPPAVGQAMIPNFAGPLLRALTELEDRARKRGRQGPPVVSPVAELRKAHAARSRPRGA
jgi:hypothetical protein